MLPSEFSPSLLKGWIREQTAQGARYSNAKVPIKKGIYERMRIEFLGRVSGSLSDLKTWFDSLEFREKQYLPLLYEYKFNQNVKNMLVDEISKQSNEDKRLFLRLIDAMYRTNDEQLFLPIIRSCYRKHQKRLARSLGTENISKWETFIFNEPKKVLINLVNHSSVKFEQVVKEYYLLPNHSYYEEVVFSFFEHTNQSGFLKNLDIFNYYLKSRNNIIQQKLVSYFLNKCELNRFHDTVIMIYDLIRTYRVQPNLWMDITLDLKEKFANYFLNYTLREFFDGLEASNRERFQYWNKYRFEMKDVLVLDHRNSNKSEKTIVLYFQNEVVVEILGVGAAYVYDQSQFQPKFGSLIENARNRLSWRHKPYMIPLARNQFMYPDLVKTSYYREPYYSETEKINGKLIHSNKWQDKFDKYFKGLGWEVDANVLAQKSKRFFGIKDK
jgi:hypothetical protein